MLLYYTIILYTILLYIIHIISYLILYSSSPLIYSPIFLLSQYSPPQSFLSQTIYPSSSNHLLSFLLFSSDTSSSYILPFQYPSPASSFYFHLLFPSDLSSNHLSSFQFPTILYVSVLQYTYLYSVNIQTTNQHGDILIYIPDSYILT